MIGDRQGAGEVVGEGRAPVFDLLCAREWGSGSIDRADVFVQRLGGREFCGHHTEVMKECFSVGCAFLRIALKRPHDDLGHFGGDGGLEGIGPRDVGVTNKVDTAEVVGIEKQAAMAKHLPQDHAHRKEVCLRADFAAACLLGSHVRDFAFEYACGREREVICHPSDAKVGDFDGAFAIQQEVVGGDVAVGEEHWLALDFECMGVMERTCRLDGDLDGVGDGKGPSLFLPKTQEMLQIGAIDPLHRHKQIVSILAELVRLNDMRVFQQSCDAAFVEEHLDKGRMVFVFGMQSFDGEFAEGAVGVLCGGIKDLAHSADSHSLDKSVTTELLRDIKGFHHAVLVAL